MSPLGISSLLRDEALRRREFPVCEDKVFLAHAGVSPLPRRVAEAMKQYRGGGVTRQPGERDFR